MMGAKRVALLLALLACMAPLLVADDDQGIDISRGIRSTKSVRKRGANTAGGTTPKRRTLKEPPGDAVAEVSNMSPTSNVLLVGWSPSYPLSPLPSTLYPYPLPSILSLSLQEDKFLD